jgi:hypothetical protein
LAFEISHFRDEMPTTKGKTKTEVYSEYRLNAFLSMMFEAVMNFSFI